LLREFSVDEIFDLVQVEAALASGNLEDAGFQRVHSLRDIPVTWAVGSIATMVRMPTRSYMPHLVFRRFSA
jgi:hypothetical protein